MRWVTWVQIEWWTWPDPGSIGLTCKRKLNTSLPTNVAASSKKSPNPHPPPPPPKSTNGEHYDNCPFEMVSIDFLHLEKSQRGFEYILLIADHFTSLHRTTQPETRQHERWLKRFTTILYHDLDFQPVYTVIKEESLRTISSVNCINCLACPSLAPAPTTLKGMGNLRG